jgi:glycerol-3-phosphate acyltransferase PlsX
MDANKRNGGILLGLNGLVVKSHGNATDEGFACAIDIGFRASKNDLFQRISHLLDLPR